jgi:RNA polymerase sigma factor (sigma-70 family)
LDETAAVRSGDGAGRDAAALRERIAALTVEFGMAPPADFDPQDERQVDEAASALLHRFHERDDAAAFTLLVELTQARLHRIGRQVTRHLAMALDPDDLVAAFFARLFTDVRRPQPVVRRFLGLAYTAMRNDALNQLRQFKRAQARHELWGREQLMARWADPTRGADDREQSRVLLRLGTLFLCVVNQCFHELPERDRRVLLAREIDKLTYDGIADALGLPRGQVGMILKRAREHLGDRIGHCLLRLGGSPQAPSRTRGARRVQSAGTTGTAGDGETRPRPASRPRQPRGRGASERPAAAAEQDGT